ncbi:MFS transporter [Lichenicoccus sp.]|uniref:MFS transporter n=1 Tax=Lichenicoccus sp. TaxID=2781899 RepID=UPI003D0CD28C
MVQPRRLSPSLQAGSETGYRALLRQPGFGLFFAATTASTLGSAVVPVALTFALLQIGYTATAVGLVLAAQTAPTVILLIAGGVIGDRWPRRRIMMGADALRCLCQSGLAALLATGHPSLLFLMLLAGCLGVGNAFFSPAESGLIPEIAGEKSRIKAANSLLGISNSLSAILGPVIGGILVGLGDAPLAIGLDAFSYAASAACLAFISIPAHEKHDSTSFLSELRQGWSEFRQHRWLLLVTAQYGLLNLVTFAPFFVLGPVIFSSMPHGARSWGLIASATGVGGVLGGLLILKIRPSRPLVAYEISAALLAAPLVVLAVHASVPVLMASSAVFGLALSILNVTVQTTIQERIPEDVLSRINALFSVVATGLGPIGFALCGPVAHYAGPRNALGVGSGITLVSAAALLCLGHIRHVKAIRMP